MCSTASDQIYSMNCANDIASSTESAYKRFTVNDKICALFSSVTRCSKRVTHTVKMNIIYSWLIAIIWDTFLSVNFAIPKIIRRGPGLPWNFHIYTAVSKQVFSNMAWDLLTVANLSHVSKSLSTKLTNMHFIMAFCSNPGPCIKFCGSMHTNYTLTWLRMIIYRAKDTTSMLS